MIDKCLILIIDDESAMRHLLRTILEEEHYTVDEAQDGQQALDKITEHPYDLVLCDIRMPVLGGIDFLEQALRKRPDLTVIMMSAYGSLETAIDCMKHGAYDYIAKPFRPDEIVLTLRKALERLRLQQENITLRSQLRNSETIPQIIGDSPAIKHLLQQIETLAAVDSPVLVLGETGTGKELVARALHDQSPRRMRPFVAVNCSAISPHLVESELFGHRKGAFTGATSTHDGLFAAANGGTLFLDEIGELPLEFQPKLLRVLQENEIRPVGATKPTKVNVRIVAATARNLKEAVKRGTFREDLFYRLAVVELEIPPLRSRPEDIDLLCHYFINNAAKQNHRPVPQLTTSFLSRLKNYDWPGNIRELKSTLERSMIFQQGSELTCRDLPAELSTDDDHSHTPGENDDLSLKKAIEDLERSYIQKALERCNGNRTLAAQQLEISLRALHYKIKSYHL
nr:sigma-54 dependent transcriptional regulator [uncultured Desulfuromonas sp.]